MNNLQELFNKFKKNRVSYSAHFETDSDNKIKIKIHAYLSNTTNYDCYYIFDENGNFVEQIFYGD